MSFPKEVGSHVYEGACGRARLCMIGKAGPRSVVVWTWVFKSNKSLMNTCWVLSVLSTVGDQTSCVPSAHGLPSSRAGEAGVQAGPINTG